MRGLHPQRAAARTHAGSFGFSDDGAASLALFGVVAMLGALGLLGAALGGVLDAACSVAAPGLHFVCAPS
jgi:hypothetical protein